MPHQRVIQHLGAFGQSAFERQPHKIAALVDYVRLQTLGGQTGLVIVHKKFEADFRGLPGVSTLHHGGAVGDDAFGAVDHLFNFGGRFPPPKEIARLASAATGRRVPIARPERVPCVALLADGSGVAFERLAYADPAAQAALAGVYDTDVIQNIGRGRGLNRTAANPVTTHQFGNVQLSFPVDEIKRWRRPSRLYRMMSHEIVPLGGAGMNRRYPDLFPSAEAARTAKHRWGGEAVLLNTLRNLADRMPWRSDLVTLQPLGQGHKRTCLIVARHRVKQVRAEAIAQFGGLASWHVEPFSPGTKPLADMTVTFAGKEEKETFAENVTVLGADWPPPIVERPPSHAPP